MHQTGRGTRTSWQQRWRARIDLALRATWTWTPWRLNAVNWLLSPLPYHLVWPVRTKLYRWAGLRGIDSTVFFEGPLHLRARPHAYKRVQIGARSEVFGPCWIEAGADVSIGTDVGICIGASIFTSSHAIGPATRRMGALASQPVRIEDGAWIGAKAVITAGVTVGKGSIVGPGSLVLRDVPPNTMVQGSPARVVRWLEADAAAAASASSQSATASASALAGGEEAGLVQIRALRARRG